MTGWYFGLYRSSTTGTTGCVHEFLTEARDQQNFPAQVTRRCSLCGHEHGFRLVTTHQATTPKRRASLLAWAGERMEIDVRL